MAQAKREVGNTTCGETVVVGSETSPLKHHVKVLKLYLLPQWLSKLKKNSFVILLSKGIIYESQYVKQTRGNREGSLNSRTICELDVVRLRDCLGMGGRKVGPQVF